MRYLLAFVSGAAAGVVAILLHQSLPPVGVIASLFISYSAIWLVGRRFAARSFKVVAAIGWISVLLRGSTFGEGQELLVQGDGVGSTLLLLGTLVVLCALAARA